MKTILIICLVYLLAGCSSTNNTVTNSGVLNGDWEVIKQEIGGKDLPLAPSENQRLTILDNSFLFSAEGIDEGSITYSAGKMDIYVKEGVNVGKHFPAIYKLEDDVLTICYNLAGDVYPKDFETESNPNFFLTVFKKSQTKQ